MPNFTLELGKMVGSVGVKAVYGEQVDVDGVRLVPVAVTASGFGGGEFTHDDATDGGGGGGGFAAPIGAYVRQGDTIRFEPNVIALLTVGIPFVWVAGKALSRVIRALKR